MICDTSYTEEYFKINTIKIAINIFPYTLLPTSLLNMPKNNKLHLVPF